MELLEIVNKLVGPIEPIGETNTDNERFENLKIICELADDLLQKIASVSSSNRLAHAASVKRATIYARRFLNEVCDSINTRELNDH